MSKVVKKPAEQADTPAEGQVEKVYAGEVSVRGLYGYV